MWIDRLARRKTGRICGIVPIERTASYVMREGDLATAV
jgi:hypothetical protein